MTRGGGRRFAAVVAAGALLFVGAAGTGGAAAGPGSGPPAGAGPGDPRAGGGPSRASVTLITGDVVTVETYAGGGRSVSAKPGPGREDVTFLKTTRKGSLRVVPSDALELLNRGVLDPALFEVTALIKGGFDDRSTPVLPLIVRYEGAAPSARSSVARTAAAGRDLPSIQAQAVAERKADAGTFWRTVAAAPSGSVARSFAPGIARIWLDGRVRVSLDRSVPQIGAPQAWQAGLTGEGVTTAVLDTGIDATHPDLADAVAVSADFTGDAEGPVDRHGHGTHVASIITGSGAASQGAYKGVAPDTRLAVGKVLDDDGFGSFSGIIAGMEWAAQHARVVNMSLGSAPTDGTDPMSLAVNTLSASTGALFVIAAGNDWAEGTVSSPSTADAALSVGAVDANNVRAPFSSQGPRRGDHAVKPELTAPGVAIAAARAAGSRLGDPVNDHYTRLSGTSMATPHVAGAAAILAEQHPDWSGTRIKDALIGSTTPGPDMTVFQQGTGRVDIPAAITRTVSAGPGAVSVFLRWPTPDPVARSVEYRNDGAAPVVLDLAVSGDIAPLMRLDANRVTVPAHGTARVGLTVDPKAVETGATHSGVLVASGPDGAALVRTALGVYEEPELYDLRVRAMDRTGAPMVGGAVVIADIDTGEWYEPQLQGDALVVRVPPGRYSVDAMIHTPADGPRKRSWTLVSLPDTAVRADVDLVADAAAGMPAGVSLDEKGTTVEHRRLALAEEFPNGGVGIEALLYGTQSDAFAAPVADAGAGYRYMVSAFLDKPAAAGKPGARYNLALSRQKGVPADPTLPVKSRDLAVVDTRFHLSGDGELDGSMTRSAGWNNSEYGGWFRPVSLPGTGKEYFTVAPGLTWISWLQRLDDFSTEQNWAVSYPKGRTTAESWNRAPVSPRPLLSRCEDALYGMTGPFTPAGPRRIREGDFASGKVTLLRNGTEIASSEDVMYTHLAGLPPERSAYALRLQAEREGLGSSTGKRVDVTWTFSSARPEFCGEDESAVTVPMVHIDADVDLRNRLPGDRPHVFTAAVDRSYPFGPAEVRHFAISASYDDGATWLRLPAIPNGKGGFTVLAPPPPRTGNGFVSLRTSVRDANGTTQDLTLLRAYAVANR